jgi:hypothetical protein
LARTANNNHLSLFFAIVGRKRDEEIGEEIEDDEEMGSDEEDGLDSISDIDDNGNFFLSCGIVINY